MIYEFSEDFWHTCVSLVQILILTTVASAATDIYLVCKLLLELVHYTIWLVQSVKSVLPISIISIATTFSCSQVLHLKFLLQVLQLPFFYNINYFDYISNSCYLSTTLISVLGNA